MYATEICRITLDIGLFHAHMSKHAIRCRSLSLSFYRDKYRVVTYMLNAHIHTPKENSFRLIRNSVVCVSTVVAVIVIMTILMIVLHAAAADHHHMMMIVAALKRFSFRTFFVCAARD